MEASPRTRLSTGGLWLDFRKNYHHFKKIKKKLALAAHSRTLESLKKRDTKTPGKVSKRVSVDPRAPILQQL